MRVGADRLSRRSAEPRHAGLVLRDGEHAQALGSEATLRPAAAPPGGVALVLGPHPGEGDCPHVDLDEERRRTTRRRDHGACVGDERDTLSATTAHEMHRVSELVARGLPAQELDHALRVEKLEDHREVVLQELVVEDGRASGAADRHRLFTRPLSKKSRAAQGKGVGPGAGGAGEHPDLTITDEALEDGSHDVGRAADERDELVQCEVLALGESGEELREPRRLRG